MRGSQPDWADSDDHATLEEVFTSRSFGHPLPEAPAPAVVPKVGTAMPHFVHNPFIASAAAAAAALSVVAGLTIGGPAGQSLLSAHSAGPYVPDFGSSADHRARSHGRAGGIADRGQLRNRQSVQRCVTGLQRAGADVVRQRRCRDCASTAERGLDASNPDRGPDGLFRPAGERDESPAPSSTTTRRRQRRPPPLRHRRRRRPPPRFPSRQLLVARPRGWRWWQRDRLRWNGDSGTGTTGTGSTGSRQWR